MKTVAVVTITAALLGPAAGLAQNGVGPGMGSQGGMGMMSGSSVRRNFVMRNGIDPKYAGLRTHYRAPQTTSRADGSSMIKTVPLAMGRRVWVTVPPRRASDHLRRA
jgi:hypothetical protein